MLALGLCITLGLGGGMAVTMWTEPDASAAVVAGAVEDSLGGEADQAPGTGAGPETAGDVPRFPEPSASASVVPPTRIPSPRPSPSPSMSQGPAPVEPEPGSGLLGDRISVEPELSGELVVARGSSPAPADGEVWRVQVAVEKGLPVDPVAFADAVLTILNDPRGWHGADGSTFARTDSEQYDARVVLASPGTTDTMCLPLDTIGELSCGIEETAVLNFKRWATGSQAWAKIAHYRQYLVNHEVGHVIGYRHDLCAGEGQPATVMVQQTTTTSGCVPEPWPAPDAG